MTSITARLRHHIRNFAAARDGNVAMIFALMSLPVVGAMGYAIDYSRANAAKADLQSALDAAALMVSKTAGTMTQDQLQSAAESYFGALFKNPEGFGYKVTASYNSSGGSAVTLTGLTSVKTDFLGIVGHRTMDVHSSATVKTALKSKIDSLKAAGNTNQGIGLQWGFQSLTSAPFAIPAKSSNYKYSDVIILMSDGLNTENRYSTTQSAIDAREKITCDNVKAAGTLVYSIQVNTSGDPTSTLLKNCASSADKFFLLTSADQMVTTFKSIGTELTQLRIAK